MKLIITIFGVLVFAAVLLAIYANETLGGHFGLNLTWSLGFVLACVVSIITVLVRQEVKSDQDPEALKMFEQRWIGKEVLVLGDHPHAGETAKIVDWAKTIDNKYGLYAEGENEVFMIFHAHNMKVLN